MSVKATTHKEPAGLSKQNALSVSALNTSVKQLLEQNFGSVWLRAEISNFSVPGSGHWYFSLKDPQAQIRAAMFRQNNRLCKTKPNAGDAVLIRGRLSLYAPRGDYQIIVDHLEPAGRGNLQAALEQLKSKLAAEGLFDDQLKQPLPTYPSRIGVISSPTGAAVRDILQVLKRRCPATPITLYPTAVQGEAATTEIVQAIQLANQHNQSDVLILARGGGSIEDLWCFNEESVARAIVASKIPIVSGVGHQTDITLADFVADLRSPTPSAAAEQAGPDQGALLKTLINHEQWFFKQILRLVQSHMSTLAHIKKRLKHPDQRLEELSQRADELSERLKRAIYHKLHACKPTLTVLRLRLQHALPTAVIDSHQRKIVEVNRRLSSALINHHASAEKKWHYLAHRLNLISPLATLERGYTITLDAQEGILNNYQNCHEGQVITTRLMNGTIKSKIISLDSNPE